MNPTSKRYGISGLIFLAGLLAGVGLAYQGVIGLGSYQAVQQIAPNTVIFSALDEEIMSLTYHTQALALTAQRSKPADQFSIQVTFADGRKPQQCLASPDLGGLLTQFSKITAKRQVEKHHFEKEFPRHLGTLEIRDRIVAETPPSMEFRSTANRESVAVSYNGYAAEISTKLNAFVRLEAGCEALAQQLKGVKKMGTNNQYLIQEPSSHNQLSLEQVKTIAREINAMSRVIGRESTLDQEKGILGEIEYTYPKDPEKTITSASFNIPLMDHFGSFTRVNDKLPWHTSGLLIAEEQEPYTMGLTRYFFTKELGLVFDKAVLEKREDTSIPAYHVFYFHKKIDNVTLQYVFDTRPDASHLKDGYPKSFHEVRIFDPAGK